MSCVLRYFRPALGIPHSGPHGQDTVSGATNEEGIAILDHLLFVRKGLSEKSSGLDLSLVGDLLSGKNLPLLGQLRQAGR